MIDYEKLGDLEDANKGWRAGIATNLSDRYVSGEGEAEIPEAFIIGEAPGADEDVARRPFVGPAGQVLRQLMLLADLATDDWQSDHNRTYGVANCWLTNVVKFRPLPRNRTPDWSEVSSVRHLLREEWQAVGSPRLIIPIGGVALSAILGHQRTSILRAAGKCHYYASKKTGKGTPTLAIWPMVHPSFVMRQNSGPLQEVIEQDWIRLGQWRTKNNVKIP